MSVVRYYCIVVVRRTLVHGSFSTTSDRGSASHRVDAMVRLHFFQTELFCSVIYSPISLCWKKNRTVSMGRSHIDDVIGCVLPRPGVGLSSVLA
eukprot:scaffold4244_cov167-Amphora_coffeaeformis.AAC.17